jgi:hypothetical protein
MMKFILLKGVRVWGGINSIIAEVLQQRDHGCGLIGLIWQDLPIRGQNSFCLGQKRTPNSQVSCM